MSRTVTVREQRGAPASWMQRVGHSLRSYWTGEFNLKDPALNRLFGYGSKSLAGPAVTEHTMFTCAAVFDAVNQIASDVAKLPLDLKKRRPNGGSDDYAVSKSYRLMKFSPNPEMRSMVFRRTMMVHALITKGGFAEIERDGAGRPAALWILEPHRVTPFYDIGAISPDGRKNPLRYRYREDNGSDTIYEANDMLHLQGLGWDGVTGFEMVQVAREAIGLALASQQFASAFFGNQTRFGGILSSENLDLDEQQKEEIRAQIEKLHASADKAFRLLILGAGFKYTQAGVNPDNAQMQEIRDQQVMEVARFFNMPLYKLKLATPGAMSYASVEMNAIDYYKGPILNWVTLWEQELQAKLIPPSEQNLQFFKHNVKGFLRGDDKSRSDALAIMRDKGIINANEWRELEDMNPLEGEQGSVYIVQSGFMPLDLLQKKIQADIDKLNTPTPAPAGPTQQDVDAEANRANRAEQAAAEARNDVVTAREKLAALEASEQATKAERDAQKAEVERLTALSTEMTVLASEMKRQADDLRTAHEALGEQLTQEVSAREAAERATADAQAAAAQAAAERDAKIAAIEEAVAVAERTKAAAEAAQVRVAEVEAALSQAGSDRASLEVQRAAAQERADAAAAAAGEAETAKAAALSAAALATTRAEQAESTLAERESALAQAKAEQQAAVEVRTAAEASRAESTAEQERLRAALAVLEAKAAEEAAARALAETELATQRSAERERLLAVLAAHRGLIVDAMTRMTRRECQQARSKQATPEKLRRWLVSFPELHEAICVEALLPAIRTHLAWQRSSEDPVAVTTALVKDHIATFTGRMQFVLDSEPVEFAAELERVLARWESDRAGQVADAILAEEIRHVAA